MKCQKITKFSKNPLQNNSKTVTNDKEIFKKRYISPEERQKNIDNLRSIIIVQWWNIKRKKMFNTPNQRTKFRTKNWVEINDELWEKYNKDTEIRFKISMSSSSLCDHRDAYTLVLK